MEEDLLEKLARDIGLTKITDDLFEYALHNYPIDVVTRSFVAKVTGMCNMDFEDQATCAFLLWNALENAR